MGKYSTGLLYKTCLYSGNEQWCPANLAQTGSGLIAAICVNKATRQIDVDFDPANKDLKSKVDTELKHVFEVLGISTLQQAEYRINDTESKETRYVPLVRARRKRLFGWFFDSRLMLIAVLTAAISCSNFHATNEALLAKKDFAAVKRNADREYRKDSTSLEALYFMYWADVPEHPTATVTDTNKYLESFERHFVNSQAPNASGVADSLRMRKFSRIFVSIALKYFYRNSFEDAIKWFKLAESSFTGDAQFNALIASCYMMTKQNSAAIAHLRTVVDSLNPQDARSCYNLGCLYSLQGDTTDAIRFLSMAIKLDPEYRAKMARDPDFDGIQASDQFAALQDTTTVQAVADSGAVVSK